MEASAATEPRRQEPPRQRAGGFLTSPAFRQSVSPLVFFVVFMGFGLWLGSEYFNVPARVLDVHQNVPLLILGLAAMITLATGYFDLSIAGMATLTTFLSIGLRSNQGWEMWLVIVACIAIGLIGGLINGLLVIKVRVNTFIATLGTGGIFAGLSAAYSGGTQLTPSPEGPQLPSWFTGKESFASFSNKVPSVLLWVGVAVLLLIAWRALRAHRPERFATRTWDGAAVAIVLVGLAAAIGLFDLPDWIDETTWLVTFLLGLTSLMWVLMNRTSFGRHLYATGANAVAARLAGVPVARDSIGAFVIGGLLAATAGIVLAATQGSAAQGAANGLLLPAFAAAFLSTVIFSLGQFTVWGAVIGGVFLIWVSQGLIVGGISFTWTEVVNGVVLIVAVAFATIYQRRRR